MRTLMLRTLTMRFLMQLPRLMPPLMAVLRVFANEGTMRGREGLLIWRGALKMRGAPPHEDPHAGGCPS